MSRAPTTLTVVEVTARIGLSRSAVYEWMAAGRFPKPHSRGPNRTNLWLKSEVDKWERAYRAAMRKSPKPGEPGARTAMRNAAVAAMGAR